MMKLNKSLAQRIVQRTSSIIHCPINVMNENGVIIASSDVERLNQLHSGAVIALRNNEVVEIDHNRVKQWKDEVKEGINLPICYLGKIYGVVGITGEPKKVKPYAELVKMTAELILEQHLLLEKERWNRRYKEEFLFQLLKGNGQDQEIQQYADFFHFDLTEHRAVIIIQILSPTAEKLQQVVLYLEQSHFSHHLVILSPDKIALIKLGRDVKQLILKKQCHILLPPNTQVKHYKIAIGAYLDEQLPLSISYQSALKTLAYGLRFEPRKSLYCFETCKLPVMLDYFEQSWQAQILLKPLQSFYSQNENQVLQKTLKQYFLSNCDLSHTAEMLFIHPNTLRYRLVKIEQCTGLSFNKIDDKFILYLSTVLNRDL